MPGPFCLLETLPPVEVGFVYSVQACAATSAGASRRGLPLPCPPSLTRLGGRGEIRGPSPSKVTAKSRQPCPSFHVGHFLLPPGASLISRRKLCSHESYLSESPSGERGAHSRDRERDGRDGEQERNTSAPLVVTAFLCHPRPGRQSAPVEGRPSLHPRGTGSPCPSPRPPCPPPFHPALVSRQSRTCDSCAYYWFGVVGSVFF